MSAKPSHIEEWRMDLPKYHFPTFLPNDFWLGWRKHLIQIPLLHEKRRRAHECLMKNHRGGRAWAWAIASSICHHGSRHSYFTKEAKAKHKPGENHFISVQSKVGVRENAIWLLKFHSTLWEIQKAHGSWSLAKSNRQKYTMKNTVKTFAFLPTRA